MNLQHLKTARYLGREWKFIRITLARVDVTQWSWHMPTEDPLKGAGVWLGPPEDSTPHLLVVSALTESIVVVTVRLTLYASSPGQKFEIGITVTWQITPLKLWRHFELTNFVFFYNKHLSRSKNALSTIWNKLITSWNEGKIGKCA